MLLTDLGRDSSMKLANRLVVRTAPVRTQRSQGFSKVGIVGGPSCPDALADEVTQSRFGTGCCPLQRLCTPPSRSTPTGFRHRARRRLEVIVDLMEPSRILRPEI